MQGHLNGLIVIKIVFDGQRSMKQLHENSHKEYV